MGAGRIVYQELTRITKEIQDGDFFKNEALLAAMKNAKENDSAFISWDFFLMVVYTATIHISMDFLRWLREKDLRKFTYTASWTDVIHRLHQEKEFIEQLEAKMKEIGVGEIGVISGRYYAMDRDNRWDRVELAYKALTQAKA